MASVLTEKYFYDEAAAFAKLEEIRWPDGPTCPHCGAVDRINRLQGVKDRRGRVRLGLWKCYHCRGQFTVRKGTVFEASHIKLHEWFQASHLMCSSKKGVSANQLHRTLGCTLKTGWFVSMHLREAMRDGRLPLLGGEGKILEADTTYVGGREKNKHMKKRVAGNIGGAGKEIVHALVERNGNVRSHHIPSVSGETLRPLLFGNASLKSRLMTDTAGGYLHLGRKFAGHEMVDHGALEYVRYIEDADPIHSNTVEGVFSILKRGIIGTYHHVSRKHLHRYLAEFDFRYNNRVALGVNDNARTVALLKGAEGKRLTYRVVGKVA
ncbi:MAG TPA: IS1595 family transposase [Rhizomicrobium sp.]|nr:IS1595 family transposase [Rhizomicrobium sp.]